MSLRARYRTAADAGVLVEQLHEIDKAAQVDELIETLAGPGTHDAMITHLGRSLWNDEIPDHEVAVGVRGHVGAMWFADDTGTWCTKGDGPAEPPEYAEGTFPAYCEIPVEQLANALKEFLATTQRPTIVEWQPVE